MKRRFLGNYYYYFFFLFFIVFLFFFYCRPKTRGKFRKEEDWNLIKSFYNMRPFAVIGQDSADSTEVERVRGKAHKK